MLEDISGQQIRDQFKSNKRLRMTTMIVGGLLVLLLGYFAYRQFVWKPANDKSKDAYWESLNYAVADSTDVALDGMQAVVKKYDGKIGGEIAQFSLARQFMEKGEYKKALTELENVEVNDTYVKIMAIGLQADCHSEMGEYETAANKYLEAADMSDNEFTAPIYLFKAGLCAEEIKNFDKAVEFYERIRDDYSAFHAQKQIDKYLARARSKTTSGK
jgi:predicted negative regulator of RcsB-dependent stress response